MTIMGDLKTKLRIENSLNRSGRLLSPGRIPVLKESNYYVSTILLDGDAPKQFINAYFFEVEGKVRKRNHKSWPAFIAKTAEKWYPHESVIEYLINCIGIELGIRMNEVKLVKANGQIRFLSKYFLNPGEKLIHGAEICGEFLEDHMLAMQIANDRKSAREMFTFEFVQKAIEAHFPNYSSEILLDLVKMLTFDALVGNNDRHFYNWGVVASQKKVDRAPRLAPVYDSARGLFWNLSDKNLVAMYDSHNNDGKKVVNYIKNASPRIGIEGNSKANHFALIGFLKSLDPAFRKLIGELSDPVVQSRVLDMISVRFSPIFIRERNELIKFVINARFEKVRSA